MHFSHTVLGEIYIILMLRPLGILYDNLIKADRWRGAQTILISWKSKIFQQATYIFWTDFVTIRKPLCDSYYRMVHKVYKNPFISF